MEAPAPKPGQMMLWAMQSIAHGADFVSFFRWRTSVMGSEITIKTPVEDMDTVEKVQGQRAFLKIQIRNSCAMKSMGTKERDRTYWTSNKADMSVSFLFGGKNRNKPTTFVVSMELYGIRTRGLHNANVARSQLR